MLPVNADDLREVVRAYAASQGKVAKKTRIWFTDGEVEQLTVPSRGPGKADGARQHTHSPDFRSVLWNGNLHSFTDRQAAVVKSLWEAWQLGTPEMSQASLLEINESTAERLRDLFRSSSAWGTMIVAGERKGAYRLAG